jgi:hypothetical protein
VKHHASSRFWRAYRALPEEIRKLADAKYGLLKVDPTHPSLHLKRLGVYWSVRVGLHYRALAVEAGDDLVWFWIGSHAEYDALLGHKPRVPTPRRGVPRKTKSPTR